MDGKRLMTHRYRRANASKNSRLFNVKYSLSSGSVVSQLDDPFIRARSFALHCSRVITDLTFASVSLFFCSRFLTISRRISVV